MSAHGGEVLGGMRMCEEDQLSDRGGKRGTRNRALFITSYPSW